MEALSERLLTAWLRISTAVINSRLVSELPYKEALVCHILYRNLEHQQETPLTATHLCRQTNMAKSQMNRVLGSLEKKGLITRQRSEKDRRQIFVRFAPERAQLYEVQHQRILELLDRIIARLGDEDTEQVIHYLSRVADAAQDALNEPEPAMSLPDQ